MNQSKSNIAETDASNKTSISDLNSVMDIGETEDIATLEDTSENNEENIDKSNIENTNENEQETKEEIFMDKKFLEIGLAKCKIEDIEINIYDKERMLIELIRYKTKLPYELYKEVINNYRKIKNELNFIKIYNYAKTFNSPYIIQTIEKEVM